MRQQIKTVLAPVGVALVAGMAVLFAVSRVRGFHGGGEAGAKVWFYDEHAKRLYAAPRDLAPPDGDEWRVRAVLVGFKGLKGEGLSQRIAYLEKYSREFKALLDRARAAHEARRPFEEKIPASGSDYAKANTMVRRVDETAWHRMDEPEALEITREWRGWTGPGGEPAIIRMPAEN